MATKEPAPSAKDIPAPLTSAMHEAGANTTSNQGVRVGNDLDSLKAGDRGPTLLEDFLLREKITHFDHERIPERVVHARGTGAHGYFQVYEDLSAISKAAVFRDPAKKTPVFVRFSTVAGSRGSIDTPRDVRGFAVKFYTDEGVWDLVGNNIPVFFVQDAAQFPDFVHAVKPEPHNEIPQAQSAHDTFWDYVSLTTESTHMLLWVMSDRALPRSFAMMEGFGVNTYRLVDRAGRGRFVKFHWKPKKGLHSLVWDEAQKLGGKDPDFHRRELFESIERGDYPEWELGLQVFTDEEAAQFPFDVLDATKFVPEDLVPVRRVGRMVLNRNTDNFFAETEQVAFCPSHIVPGIDFSNDPLLQGRLFSYLDTQISRLGVNFAELPINQPVCPVSNNQRDGKMRHRIDRGRAAYFPNSTGGGCPMHSPAAAAAFTAYAEPMQGVKRAHRSDSFKEHFSQATLFWNSMAPWEREHIIGAFSFELNMVVSEEIRQRVLDEILVNIDEHLAQGVAERIGLRIKGRRKSASHAQRALSLSMDRLTETITGRQIAILVCEGSDASHVKTIKSRLATEGLVCEVVAPVAGTVKGMHGDIAVDRPLPNAASVLYDAVIIPGGAQVAATMTTTGQTLHFIQEAFLHHKPIAAVGEAGDMLRTLRLAPAEGVVYGSDPDHIARDFMDALRHHRYFSRVTLMVPG